MNHTTIVQIESQIATTYIVGCLFVLFFVGLCLFGSIRKTSCFYISFEWIKLKFLMCCCPNKNAGLVERNARETSDLLAEMDSQIA